MRKILVGKDFSIAILIDVEVFCPGAHAGVAFCLLLRILPPGAYLHFFTLLEIRPFAIIFLGRQGNAPRALQGERASGELLPELFIPSRQP